MGLDQTEGWNAARPGRLDGIPDLNQSFRTASPQDKRQVFKACNLQIHFNKREGRVGISATVSVAVAMALDTKGPLAREGLEVARKTWREPASSLRGTF